MSQLTPRQFNHRKSSVVLQNPSETCTARSTAFFEPKNANKPGKVAWLAKFLAPRVGFEPTTLRLTGAPDLGNSFTYWEGAKYYPGDKYTVIENRTFMAQWEKNTTPNNNKDTATTTKSFTPKTGDGLAVMGFEVASLASFALVLLAGLRLRRREQD